MLTIVITDTDARADEARCIAALLDSGAADRVHIRKPGWAEADVRRLVEAVPERLRSRLSLHDYHRLAASLGVGGVHLNGRNPDAPEDFTGLISRSCHSLDEVTQCADATAYRFLSPVFDSISKTGYAGRFAGAVTGLPPATVALGGVTPARFGEVSAMGFDGAALLGYVWRHPGGMEAAISEIIISKKNIDASVYHTSE